MHASGFLFCFAFGCVCVGKCTVNGRSASFLCVSRLQHKHRILCSWCLLGKLSCHWVVSFHFTRFSRLVLNSLRSTDRKDCDPPVLAPRAVESQASTLRPSSVFCLSVFRLLLLRNHLKRTVESSVFYPQHLTWRAQCKNRNKKVLNLSFPSCSF